MQAYGIPGVAVGLIHGSTTFIRGYGVTNVDYPVPVDGDTLFRIGSTAKTFTGSTAMRLVERGDLDLDARVRKYLPHFKTSQAQVANRVTVRQLLNHSAWLGEYYGDLGRGDDALARYAEAMAKPSADARRGGVRLQRGAGARWPGDRGRDRIDLRAGR